MTPRYPIEVVRRLRPPAPVRLGGRVIEVTDESARVRDITGDVWVSGPAVLGAWVIAEGTWNGERVDGECHLANPPRAPFPQPDGDWLSFQASGRVHRLRVRARVHRAVRDFFDQRAFLEVETPAMVPSPGLDPHLDAYPVAGEDPARWLITSPEYQMKRVLAGGVPRIYQVCRCFRRGELGAWHQPEFTMLEWYRAFAGSAEVMRDTEQLVAHVAEAVGGSPYLTVGTPIDVTPPWDRITVAEAFQRYAGQDIDSILPDEERFFRILVDQVEPQLGRLRPVFLTGWPASMASLARLDPKNPAVADRFEAYVGGVELCNGFGELIDPVEQRARLQADQARREVEGKMIYPLDERFLGALEEGLPPCGGNALGFDRLLMFVLGVSAIDEVVAIPAQRL